MVVASVNKINSSFEKTVEYVVAQTHGCVVFLLAKNKIGGYTDAGELAQLLGSFLRGDISSEI